ncbi:hypothetical protein [Methylobacterium gnaphalii]|uniref:hypothetical protein n=1 Tax=Methylobacterium gnaphalii TaxID=1010610 RepID=UPI00147931E0|nr:hypothetical protein [Methylobacterium gnaphalii]GJD68398.1 hypothetical protein MMMDOFMJ_1321 [Methylobacterium gnaphalii]
MTESFLPILFLVAAFSVTAVAAAFLTRLVLRRRRTEKPVAQECDPRDLRTW